MSSEQPTRPRTEKEITKEEYEEYDRRQQLGDFEKEFFPPLSQLTTPATLYQFLDGAQRLLASHTYKGKYLFVASGRRFIDVVWDALGCQGGILPPKPEFPLMDPLGPMVDRAVNEGRCQEQLREAINTAMRCCQESIGAEGGVKIRLRIPGFPGKLHIPPEYGVCFEQANRLCWETGVAKAGQRLQKLFYVLLAYHPQGLPADQAQELLGDIDPDTLRRYMTDLKAPLKEIHFPFVPQYDGDGNIGLAARSFAKDSKK